MKKLLIGCGIVSLIAVVLLVGTVVWVGLKIQRVQSGWKEGLADIKALDAKYPFAPPEDGALTEDRFEDYLAIRDAMMEKLTGNPTVVKLLEHSGSEPPDIGMGEAVTLLSDFPRELLTEFRDELDSREMSPDEFFYNIKVVYTTIQEGKEGGDASMRELYDNLERGVDNINDHLEGTDYSEGQISLDESILRFNEVAGKSLPENIDLVAREKYRLMEHPEITFFELLALNSMEEAMKAGE